MAKLRLPQPTRWNVDHEAEPGETHNVLLFLGRAEVDEHPARASDLSLLADGFVTVEVRGVTREAIADRYGPEDYLEGTDETKLVLPVTELEFA